RSPDAPPASVDVLAGQARKWPRVERGPGAVRRDDDRDAEAGALARVAHRVEHQVRERGDPAEPAAVAARVDLDLQPSAAVGDVVLRGLTDQPTYVVLGAEHRPRDVIQALEAEPALLVGGSQLGRPLGDEGVRQAD